MQPDEFLRAFHQRHPGISVACFGRGQLVETGRTGYQELAAAVADVAGTLVDLGCGDGPLVELLARDDRAVIGLDMSAGELAAARQRLGPTALLVRGHATAMPLATSSVDAITSHMAFMLMSPVEAVVAELARLLRPGGRFVAAVGGGPCADDGFELFLTLLRQIYDQLPRRPPRLGDRRSRDPDGLRQLFSPATGFREPTIRALTHRLDGTADELWSALWSIYELYWATDDQLAQLRQRFIEESAALADADGVVPCAMRARMVVVERAQGRG